MSKAERAEEAAKLAATHKALFRSLGGHRQTYSYLRGGPPERPSHAAAQTIPSGPSAPASRGGGGSQGQATGDTSGGFGGGGGGAGGLMKLKSRRMTARAASAAAAASMANPATGNGFNRSVWQGKFQRNISRV